MISKEELAQCLRDAHYTEEQIERAVSVQITSIQRLGKAGLLERLQMLEKLQIDKNKVVSGMSYLIGRGIEDMEDIYKTLRDIGISHESIENNLKILKNGQKSTIQANMKVLTRHLTIEQINSNLFLLTETEANQLEDVLAGIDGYDLQDETIKTYLKLILTPKGAQIKENVEKLRSSNLSQEIQARVLTDVVAGKLKEVDETIILLNCELDLTEIERYAQLRQKNNADEIREVYIAINKYNPTKGAIENYQTQVYAHQWKKMKDVIQSLEEHGVSKTVIEDNLEALLKSAIKASNKIEKVLTSLDGYNIDDETMRKSLQLMLEKRGSQYIQKAIDSIETSEAVPEIKGELFAYLLPRKSKEIDQRLIILGNQGISLDTIIRYMPKIRLIEPDELQRRMQELQSDAHYNISIAKIESNMDILINNTASDIDTIFTSLSEYYSDEETINTCIELMGAGKGPQLNESLKSLKDSTLNQETKGKVFSDIIMGKLKTVDEGLITLLNCGLELESIERAPALRQKENADEIEAVHTALSKYTLTDKARENYLKQIYAHKWKPMHEIMQALEKNNIGQEIIEDNLEGLLQSAPRIVPKIDNILTNLNTYNPSEETMRTCIGLIPTGSGVAQLEKIIESIENSNVQPETKAGLFTYLLSRKSKEIDERMIMLVNRGISLDSVIRTMPKLYPIEQEELQKRMEALQNNGRYIVPIEDIENNMNLLLKNTSEELNDIFTGLSEYEAGADTIKRCIKLMSMARGKEIQAIMKSLKEHNVSKETGRASLDDLLKSRPEVTEGVLTVLNSHKISPATIERNLRQLVKLNTSSRRIDQTLTAYEKHNISPATIERTISHMPKVRADEVDDTLTAVLDYGISPSKVEEKINLLSEEKAEEVKGRIEAIKTNGYYNIPVEEVEKCMSILLNNNGEDIKAILKTLKDNNVSEKSLYEYLIIVALEKPKQIEDAFTSLNEYDLDEETINGCLKLMSEHKAKNIPEIITHLKNHQISKETVQEALKDLLRNKPEDIDGMLTALLTDHKASQKTVESSLRLLAQGYVKKEKIDKVLGAYEKYGFSPEAIESAISGLGKAKADEIDGVLKVAIVDYKIKVEALGKALNSLSAARENEVKGRLEALTKNEYYTIPIESIEECISVLTKNTGAEITAILKVLHDHSISEEAVKNCLTVLAYGNTDTIESVLEKVEGLGINIENCMILLTTKEPKKICKNFEELVTYGISPEAINNCLSITNGNFEKMHEVIKVVKKHTIGAIAVENCLSVLLAQDPEEVDKVLTILEKEKSIRKKSIESSLSMFAFIKSKKVEDFITKLKNHNVDLSALNNNLTVVLEADIDEMDGILDTLTGLGMSLEDNLSILRYTTTKRLNEIVESMQGQGIRNEAIKRELKSIVRDDGKLGIKVEDIFARRNSEDRQVQLKKAKRYMKLTGMFGQYYTREEIEPFCAERNITVREFVEGIVCSNMTKSTIGKPHSISEIYYERIMDGKKLYVGPSKPIDSEYLEEHAEEVLELARTSAKKFLRNRQTPDEDELTGLATELIMSKCGNLVDNLQEYPNALKGSIVNRTARYLYSVVEPNIMISMTQRFYNKSGEVEIKDKEYAGDVNGDNPYEPETSLHEVVDYERAEFNQDETDIMNYMIMLIEAGEADDLYQKIAENFGIEEDEVLEIIQSIRQKMIDKELVRENVERGGYEFNINDDYEESPNVDTENFDI